MTKKSFPGKVALVTGGGGRFGRVLCQALAQRGCSLVVGDCDLSAARETAAQTQGLALGLDVRDPPMWLNALTSARDLFGSVDFIFHCAQHHGEGDSAEDFTQVWATQITALEIAQRAYTADFAKTGGSHIIFVSAAAWIPDRARPLWSAAEAAKRHWHKANQQSPTRVPSTLIAYDVPPRTNGKTPNDEIAAATLWALARGTCDAFVPGGFGVRGFCRKAASD